MTKQEDLQKIVGIFDKIIKENNNEKHLSFLDGYSDDRFLGALGHFIYLMVPNAEAFPHLVALRNMPYFLYNENEKPIICCQLVNHNNYYNAFIEERLMSEFFATGESSKKCTCIFIDVPFYDVYRFFVTDLVDYLGQTTPAC